jgi:hypothetical protein
MSKHYKNNNNEENKDVEVSAVQEEVVEETPGVEEKIDVKEAKAESSESESTLITELKDLESQLNRTRNNVERAVITDKIMNLRKQIHLSKYEEAEKLVKKTEADLRKDHKINRGEVMGEINLFIH